MNQENPDRIEAVISRAQSGIFLKRCWDRFWMSSLWGLAIAATWLILFKLLPIVESYQWPVFSALFGIVFACVMLSGIRYPGKSEAAAFLDLKQGLDERISTAYEYATSNRSPENDWTRLLIQDACSRIQSIDWHKLVTFSFPRSAKWIPVLGLAILGMGFIPEWRTEEFAKEAEFRELAQDTGKELAKVLKARLHEQPEDAEELSETLIQDGLDLAENLKKTKLKKADALRKLDDLSDKVREQAMRLHNDPSQKRLSDAAEKNAAMSSNEASDMVNAMKEMEDKLGDLQSNQKELSDLSDKMQDLQDLAQSMQASLSDPTSADSQAMEKALEDLAKAMEDLGMDSNALKEALEALKNGDAEEFADKMDFATKDLEKMLEMAKALQDMQQEIGKDLAEQLEKGQLPAAIANLEDMIEKLNQGNMTDAERQEMVQELLEAAEKLEGFPQLQNQLMEAAAAAQAGEDSEAAQQLAQAAQELNNLMKEIQNAQNMEEVLAALNKAGNSLAGNKKWGALGKGNQPGGMPGMGAPGPGEGDGLGGGFGTWSDGSAPLPQQKSQLYDQSGMSQKELEARGITDRGENFESIRFSPDQVKGDLSPGSAMPSIPLHGLHMKGQSKATYQEVIQVINDSEAGSVDQTKIPRFYQESVKSYFDE